MNSIEARVKQSYYVRVGLIGLFTLGLGALPMLFQHRGWAKLFDQTGVTRRDGRRFQWAELKNVHYVHVRHRGGPRFLNHVELIFPGGKVLVFPLMLENAGEVMRLIETLGKSSVR